jgi:hypothetical protein
MCDSVVLKGETVEDGEVYYIKECEGCKGKHRTHIDMCLRKRNPFSRNPFSQNPFSQNKKGVKKGVKNIVKKGVKNIVKKGGKKVAT